jgi:putative endonuclease
VTRVPEPESAPRAAHLELGRAGERAALDYLRARGFRIVETGWRFGRGELDIIAWDGPVLVFVEVKARRDRSRGYPEEAVTPAKQRQIRKIAQAYCVRHRIVDVPCRFDVVAVETGPAPVPVLRHIPNAF